MGQQFCQWRGVGAPSLGRVPPPYRGWVVDTGSLTARLRRRCPGRFRVRLLEQGWQRPPLDEARRLGVPRRRALWVREVALCCGERPLILARTVIPAPSLAGRNGALRRLGTRPLGALLFRGRGTRREPMEVARVRAGDWLAGRWRRTGNAPLLAGCRARRVVHYLRGRPLLVTEVFLAALFDHHEPDGSERT